MASRKLGSLIVDLALNSSKLVKGIDSTNKKLNKFAKNAQRVARLAGGAFAIIQVGGLAKDLIEVVDKYKLMEGRLKLVAKEGESLAGTQEKLFQLAQRTRQDVEATTNFYVQLARATKTLDISQRELIKTTEAINKALIISGAGAQSAKAALFQLQQGMASGVLRGQELNSILEQTPRIAEAIADGMGATIGELRKLGEEGRLTTEVVVNALRSQAKVLDDEFSQVPKTVAQNMQLLTNEFEKAAKGAGGFNYVINKSIESLTNWAAAYNRIFSPAIKARLNEAVETWQRLTKELETGSRRGRNATKNLKARIAAEFELINKLNDRLIIEEKLKVDKGSSGGDDEKSKQANRIAGLVAQEELIRKNFTIQEKLNNEVIRQFSLWDGNIISVEAFTESLNRAAMAANNLNNQLAPKEAEDTEDSKLQEKLAKDVEMISQSLLTREQVELEAFSRRQFMIEDAFQNEVISWERRNELVEGLAKDHSESLQAIESQKRDSLLSSTASMFGSLAAIVGRGSKKQFELSKKLARVETIISTYSAAQKIFESLSRFGPVVAGAGAAAAVGAGLARLSAINRTSFSSSGGAAAASGAGSYVPAPSSGPVTPNQGGAATGQSIFIFTGADGQQTNIDQAEFTIERMKKQLNEGSLIMIRSDSIQAQEIALAVGQ